MSIKALAVCAAMIATVAVGVRGRANSLPSGYWESADCFVYYTRQSAIYEETSRGVSYFRTLDGEVWGAYLNDPELARGERVKLTFENRETASEFRRNEVEGNRSVTRIDNAQIVEIKED